MGFPSDLWGSRKFNGIFWDLMGFGGDLWGDLWDLGGIVGGFMGFGGDLWDFHGV